MLLEKYCGGCGKGSNRVKLLNVVLNIEKSNIALAARSIHVKIFVY